MTPADLRAARTTLGFTQTEMALACAVSQPHYSAWESGRKGMSSIADRVVELLLELGPRRARRFVRDLSGDDDVAHAAERRA